ncbi:degenerin deg-1-like [Parasteatoda tepidariorum]|uniref:degenerin deg-1-like n=1 Tax=Parasteatoda tepidariorum TaxID=114398 RepID=UPI001C722E62|nr:degenerin deg-1-like [Parasteatoda tepidariorum]
MPTITPEELPNNRSDVRNFYRRLGVPEHLFIDRVYFGKEELSPQQVSVFNFQHLPTNCFAFNTLWENSSAVLRTVNERDFFEISVSITDDNFYTATPLAIQMAVHSPFMKVDPFTTGFSIQPCSTYNMYLKKTVKYLLPAPYRTNCTDYESLWRDRGGIGPLNQKMCIDECVLNKSITKYGCFNPVYVSYPTENELFCFKEPYDDFYSLCLENCQQACYEEDIEIKVEEYVYSSTEVGSKRKNCVTRIKLLFVRMELMTFTYSKKYQEVEAFGYIGGLLGVWLGLSLVAVFDFLETCFMIFLFIVKKLMKKENNKNGKLTYLDGFKRQVMIVK